MPTTRPVLRYVDRGADDLVLYEAGVAARAKSVIELAESVSSWGDLRRLLAEDSEGVNMILDHLWLQWDGGDGAAMFGFEIENDEDEDENALTDVVPVFESRAAFVEYFPDDEPLEVPIDNDDGEPVFLDAFDPGAMGVPPELLPYYVEHVGAIDYWYLPEPSSLPEIRRTLEELGWDLEPGSMDELPHYS
jgi:hypothetical protein